MKKPGQIDLFTKRVRKPPPVPERNLHIAVADCLAHGLAPGWLATHFPAGELRTEKTGALLKRMGTQPGWPDFLLVAPPYGRLHGLELKRRGQKLRPEQEDFLNRLQAAGGYAAWVDSFDEALKVLKIWGAISTRLHLD